MSLRKNITVLEGFLFDFTNRKVGNGSVSNLTIALSEGPPPKEGEERKPSTFVDVEAWDVHPSLVNMLRNNVKKCNVFVQGRLKTDRWKTKDGESRQKLIVVADVLNYQPRKQYNVTQDKAPKEQPADAPF